MDDPDTELCSICLETLSSPPTPGGIGELLRTPCEHFFHRVCLVDWFATGLPGDCCRMCKNKMRGTESVPLSYAKFKTHFNKRKRKRGAENDPASVSNKKKRKASSAQESVGGGASASVSTSSNRSVAEASLASTPSTAVVSVTPGPGSSDSSESESDGEGPYSSARTSSAGWRRRAFRTTNPHNCQHHHHQHHQHHHHQHHQHHHHQHHHQHHQHHNHQQVYWVPYVPMVTYAVQPVIYQAPQPFYQGISYGQTGTTNFGSNGTMMMMASYGYPAGYYLPVAATHYYGNVCSVSTYFTP